MVERPPAESTVDETQTQLEKLGAANLARRQLTGQSAPLCVGSVWRRHFAADQASNRLASQGTDSTTRRKRNSPTRSKCAEEDARLGFPSFINFDNISLGKNIELQVLKD